MAAARLRASVLLLASGGASGFAGYPLPLDGHPGAGVAEDPGGNAWGSHGQWGLHNGGRVYYVENAGAGNWWGAGFVRFDLRGKTVTYIADLSGVPCGCVATLYFVAMGNPGPGAPYCDIQPGHGWNPCFELDIMEANSHAFHSSLHAEQGAATDGSCNARIGCVQNVGRFPFTRTGQKTSDLYGPGSPGIDSTRPFEVRAVFDEHGSMSVELHQDNDTVPTFNASSAGNVPDFDAWDWKSYPKPGGVPEKAIWETNAAFQGGLVLVSTLWTSGDTGWLDTAACGGQQYCNLGNSWFTVTNFKVTPNPPKEKEERKPSAARTTASSNSTANSSAASGNTSNATEAQSGNASSSSSSSGSAASSSNSSSPSNSSSAANASSSPNSSNSTASTSSPSSSASTSSSPSSSHSSSSSSSSSSSNSSSSSTTSTTVPAASTAAPGGREAAGSSSGGGATATPEASAPATTVAPATAGPVLLPPTLAPISLPPAVQPLPTIPASAPATTVAPATAGPVLLLPMLAPISLPPALQPLPTIPASMTLPPLPTLPPLEPAPTAIPAIGLREEGGLRASVRRAVPAGGLSASALLAVAGALAALLSAALLVPRVARRGRASAGAPPAAAPAAGAHDGAAEALLGAGDLAAAAA